MKKNIAFISFGTGGTLGHKTLVNNLSKQLSPFANIYVFSEYDYKSHADKNVPINWIRISGQEHKQSQGGRIEHIATQEILDRCKENNISIAIFSTFFDPKLIAMMKKSNLKTVLVSYHLREKFFLKNVEDLAYADFDRVIYLKDLYSYPLPNYIQECAPTYPEAQINKAQDQNLLITCGGGGRPSANEFVNIMKIIIPKIKEKKPSLNIIFVLGPNNNDCKIDGVSVIKSTNNLMSLLNWAKYIISEAGYFTINELIQQQKPALLIPGARRIDDQELRALMYKNNHLGEFALPEENVENIICKCNHFLEDDQKYEEYVANAKKIFEETNKIIGADIIIRELL